MKIRTLQSSDLPAVAKIHMRAFTDSALTSMGAEAVRRYYEWQLTGPHEVAALGAEIDDRLAGFCFGGLFRGAMAGFLQQNRAYLALRVATHPWLALNPIFRDRLFSGVKVLRRFPQPIATMAMPSPKDKKKPFGILAISVNPDFQGKGVGKLLMNAAEEVAIERGFERMQLSVNPANQQAIGFYLGLGWVKIPIDGPWTGEMSKPLI